MVRTMRENPTAWSQLEGIVEPENNTSGPHLEKQEDIVEGKVRVEYKLDVNNKPEGPDPNDKPVTQEEGEDNSHAEYVKIEHHCQGTLRQMIMHSLVKYWI